MSAASPSTACSFVAFLEVEESQRDESRGAGDDGELQVGRMKRRAHEASLRARVGWRLGSKRAGKNGADLCGLRMTGRADDAYIQYGERRD